MKEIRYYSKENDKIPYKDWYNSLDKSLQIIVDKRMIKLELGLYGNYRQLSDELFELKFNNGLRIYFTELDNTIILLLSGGNKSKQSKDISLSKEYISDFIERTRKGTYKCQT